MELTNPWVGYSDRSYQQIYNRILNWGMPNLVPELTDRSEANPLIVMADMFSGISEQINYAIDSQARERFLVSAQEYSSGISLVAMLDYRVKSNTPESVNLIFSIEELATEDILIPSGTICPGERGNFMTTEDAVIPLGSKLVETGAKQWAYQPNVFVGNSDGTPNQRVNLGTKYCHGTAQLTIGGDIYYEVKTFAKSLKPDTHFIVEVDSNKNSWVRFGDGITGKIPPMGIAMYLSIYVTNHVLGHTSAKSITSISNMPPLPEGVKLSVINPLQSSGSATVETLEQIKKNAPLSIRTLERAVTDQDFLDIVASVPGVGKCSISKGCGVGKSIFIAPVSVSPGIVMASGSLIQDVTKTLDIARNIQVPITVKSAGISKLKLDIVITPVYRYDGLRAKDETMSALLSKYGYTNSLINGRVMISDLYALVDNLTGVDFMNLNSLYLIPYPYKSTGITELDWDFKTQITAIQKNLYKITYTNNKFLISKNGKFFKSIVLGQEYSDEDVKFTIAGEYLPQDSWEFTSYPYNADIIVSDNTIPTILKENVSITIAKPLEKTSVSYL